MLLKKGQDINATLLPSQHMNISNIPSQTNNPPTTNVNY